LKQLQEVVGNILEHIGIRKDFLSRTQKTQYLKERMNKCDCIKLKSFCIAKETGTRHKRQHTEWEKIFASYSSIMGLISKIYKNKTKKPLNTQRINTPMKKWTHELNNELSKEEVQMTSKYTKKCSTSLVIREMQIKTTLRFHLFPLRMPIFMGDNNDKCLRNLNPYTLLVGMQISTITMESSMERPQRAKKVMPYDPVRLSYLSYLFYSLST
jgi:hypothetical protein